jgi:hypothetical protein
MTELIRFHGHYRYRSTDDLERAVAAARDVLDVDDLSEGELTGLWCHVRRGNLLAVDIVLPATSDVRFAAATVFETLATGAVEGCVDADSNGRCIDRFG